MQTLFKSERSTYMYSVVQKSSKFVVIWIDYWRRQSGHFCWQEEEI